MVPIVQLLLAAGWLSDGHIIGTPTWWWLVYNVTIEVHHVVAASADLNCNPWMSGIGLLSVASPRAEGVVFDRFTLEVEPDYSNGVAGIVGESDL